MDIFVKLALTIALITSATIIAGAATINHEKIQKLLHIAFYTEILSLFILALIGVWSF